MRTWQLSKINCPSIEKQVIHADFLDFDFDQIGKFDLIFFVGGTFGYDLSNEVTHKYLKKIESLLNYNGILVIQYLSKEWATQAVQGVKTSWKEKDDQFILDRREFQKDILKSEKIFILKNGGIVRRYSDQVRTFNFNEVESLLNDVFKDNDRMDIHSSLSNEQKSVSPLPVAIVYC